MLRDLCTHPKLNSTLKLNLVLLGMSWSRYVIIYKFKILCRLLLTYSKTLSYLLQDMLDCYYTLLSQGITAFPTSSIRGEKKEWQQICSIINWSFHTELAASLWNTPNVSKQLQGPSLTCASYAKAPPLYVQSCTTRILLHLSMDSSTWTKHARRQGSACWKQQAHHVGKWREWEKNLFKREMCCQIFWKWRAILGEEHEHDSSMENNVCANFPRLVEELPQLQDNVTKWGKPSYKSNEDGRKDCIPYWVIIGDSLLDMSDTLMGHREKWSKRRSLKRQAVLAPFRSHSWVHSTSQKSRAGVLLHFEILFFFLNQHIFLGIINSS